MPAPKGQAPKARKGKGNKSKSKKGQVLRAGAKQKRDNQDSNSRKSSRASTKSTSSRTEKEAEAEQPREILPVESPLADPLPAEPPAEPPVESQAPIEQIDDLADTFVEEEQEGISPPETAAEDDDGFLVKNAEANQPAVIEPVPDKAAESKNKAGEALKKTVMVNKIAAMLANKLVAKSDKQSETHQPQQSSVDKKQKTELPFGSGKKVKVAQRQTLYERQLAATEQHKQFKLDQQKKKEEIEKKRLEEEKKKDAIRHQKRAKRAREAKLAQAAHLHKLAEQARRAGASEAGKRAEPKEKVETKALTSQQRKEKDVDLFLEEITQVVSKQVDGDDSTSAPAAAPVAAPVATGDKQESRILARLAVVELEGMGAAQEGPLIKRLSSVERAVLGRVGKGIPVQRIVILEEALGHAHVGEETSKIATSSPNPAQRPSGSKLLPPGFSSGSPYKSLKGTRIGDKPMAESKQSASVRRQYETAEKKRLALEAKQREQQEEKERLEQAEKDKFEAAKKSRKRARAAAMRKEREAYDKQHGEGAWKVMKKAKALEHMKAVESDALKHMKAFHKEKEKEEKKGRKKKVEREEKNSEEEEEEQLDVKQIMDEKTAALLVQRIMRGARARRQTHLKKTQAANDEGMLLALPGTVDGEEGWYQHEKEVWYCSFDAEGEFVMDAPSTDMITWRQMVVMEATLLSLPPLCPWPFLRAAEICDLAHLQKLIARKKATTLEEKNDLDAHHSGRRMAWEASFYASLAAMSAAEMAREVLDDESGGLAQPEKMAEANTVRAELASQEGKQGKEAATDLAAVISKKEAKEKGKKVEKRRGQEMQNNMKSEDVADPKTGYAEALDKASEYLLIASQYRQRIDSTPPQYKGTSASLTGTVLGLGGAVGSDTTGTNGFGYNTRNVASIDALTGGSILVGARVAAVQPTGDVGQAKRESPRKRRARQQQKQLPPPQPSLQYQQHSPSPPPGGCTSPSLNRSRSRSSHASHISHASTSSTTNFGVVRLVVRLEATDGLSPSGVKAHAAVQVPRKGPVGSKHWDRALFEDVLRECELALQTKSSITALLKHQQQPAPGQRQSQSAPREVYTGADFNLSGIERMVARTTGPGQGMGAHELVLMKEAQEGDAMQMRQQEKLTRKYKGEHEQKANGGRGRKRQRGRSKGRGKSKGRNGRGHGHPNLHQHLNSKSGHSRGSRHGPQKTFKQQYAQLEQQQYMQHDMQYAQQSVHPPGYVHMPDMQSGAGATGLSKWSADNSSAGHHHGALTGASLGGDEPAGGDVSEVSEVVKAAVMIQSAFRGAAVRFDLRMQEVHAWNELGQMLAMPGTVSGHSGWYQQGDTVLQFDVDEHGEFHQVGDPILVKVWRTQEHTRVPLGPVSKKEMPTRKGSLSWGAILRLNKAKRKFHSILDKIHQQANDQPPTEQTQGQEQKQEVQKQEQEQKQRASEPARDQKAEQAEEPQSQSQQSGTAEMETIVIGVPEGAVAGSQLQIKTPDDQTIVVAVPESCPPGATFNVKYKPIDSAAQSGVAGSPQAVVQAKEVQLMEESAVVVQKLVRASQARRTVHDAKVRAANAQGRMLALKPTVQGQSGWYQQGEMVARFEVVDGEFQLREGPLSVLEYRQKRARNELEGN